MDHEEAAARTFVDSRGSACPGPITTSPWPIGVRRSATSSSLGTDPGVKSDVRAWATKTRNEVISVDDQGDKIVSSFGSCGGDAMQRVLIVGGGTGARCGQPAEQPQVRRTS